MMRSEHRARRLDATLCHIFYLAVMLVLAGLGAGLCVTNLHKFHVALTARHQAEQLMMIDGFYSQNGRGPKPKCSR